MTDKEKAIALYKQQAQKIWAMNVPWLQDGVKITVGDASKYSEMKNNIMDLMLKVAAPLLNEKDKLDLWASYSDEFDDMIRERSK